MKNSRTVKLAFIVNFQQRKFYKIISHLFTERLNLTRENKFE